MTWVIWVLIVIVALQAGANWRDIQFLKDENRSMRTGVKSLEGEMYWLARMVHDHITRGIMTGDPKEKP